MAVQFSPLVTGVLAFSSMPKVDLWYLNSLAQGRYVKRLPCLQDTHISRFLPRSLRRVVGHALDPLAGARRPTGWASIQPAPPCSLHPRVCLVPTP
eukprot:4618694-Prymnesium_polylepis.1